MLQKYLSSCKLPSQKAKMLQSGFLANCWQIAKIMRPLTLPYDPPPPLIFAMLQIAKSKSQNVAIWLFGKLLADCQNYETPYPALWRTPPLVIAMLQIAKSKSQNAAIWYFGKLLADCHKLRDPLPCPMTHPLPLLFAMLQIARSKSQNAAIWYFETTSLW